MKASFLKKKERLICKILTFCNKGFFKRKGYKKDVQTNGLNQWEKEPAVNFKHCSS